MQGLFLVHWPTFRAKQFKSREKLRGQVPEVLGGVSKWRGSKRTDTVGYGSHFKYYDGHTYREPLGVEASKRTRVDAERLSAMIQLELSAVTFDYARRFPHSRRVKTLGLKHPEVTIQSNPEAISPKR